MFKFLPGAEAVILEHADVLESAVALQILNALRGQPQEDFDLGIAGVPDMAIVARVLEQYFVGSYQAHAIVKAVGAATGFTFDVVERIRVHHRTSRPGVAPGAGQVGNHPQGLR